MTTFMSSCNLSGRLRALAYTKRHCRETLRGSADELDLAVQRYVLEPSGEHMGDLLGELNNARVLYAEVAGRPLTAD